MIALAIYILRYRGPSHQEILSVTLGPVFQELPWPR